MSSQFTLAPGETIFQTLDMLAKLEQSNDLQKDAKNMNVLKLGLNHDQIERLVRLLELRSTREAYQTYKGLYRNGLLRDPKIKWTIKKEHKDLLETLRKKHETKPGATTEEEMIAADQSIRMKQAKGFTWCFIFSTVDDSGMNYALAPRNSENK